MSLIGTLCFQCDVMWIEAFAQKDYIILLCDKIFSWHVWLCEVEGK